MVVNVVVVGVVVVLVVMIRVSVGVGDKNDASVRRGVIIELSSCSDVLFICSLVSWPLLNSFPRIVNHILQMSGACSFISCHSLVY